MFNSAMNSAFEPIFEKILQTPHMFSAFNLLNKFELKARMLSNYEQEHTLPIVALIALIEDKFNEVKILGAQDGDETDSLDYIALFHSSKLLACSEAWDQRLHEIDKNMLYLQYICSLPHPHSSYHYSDHLKSLCFETAVYLTHTGIINE